MKSLVLQRACNEDYRTGFTVAQGEAGDGVYFMIPNAKMRDYYMQGRSELVTVKLKPDHRIKDLTEKTIRAHLIAFMKVEIDKTAESMGFGYVKPKITQKNYQRFGRLITDFVNRTFDSADGWMVNHQADGTDLPKGKQVVIRNMDCFTVVESTPNNEQEMVY